MRNPRHFDRMSRVRSDFLPLEIVAEVGNPHAPRGFTSPVVVRLDCGRASPFLDTNLKEKAAPMPTGCLIPFCESWRQCRALTAATLAAHECARPSLAVRRRDGTSAVGERDVNVPSSLRSP